MLDEHAEGVRAFHGGMGAIARYRSVPWNGSMVSWGVVARVRSVPPVRESAMKTVGKPDAGNRHVRFDERGWEAGTALHGQHPRPPSTLPASCFDDSQNITGRGQ